MKILRNLSSSQRRLADGAWLIALAAYILAGTASVPFHGDESTIIYMSRDYYVQFVQRDLDGVRFRSDIPDLGEQFLRLINGSVNKYLYGLAGHLAGFTLNDVNTQWDWGADWDYNHRTNHVPPAGMLQAARTASALLLAASAVVMFALAQVAGGRGVAYLASLYYALNPTILINGRRAMFESGLLFGELLVMLLGLLWLRRPRWWTAALLGASAGLALSGKHTNLFTVAAVFGGCFCFPFVVRLVKGQEALDALDICRAILMLMVAAVMMGLVFYALNPVWWCSNPKEHAALVLESRSHLLALQTAAFGGYHSVPEQAVGFARQVFVNLPAYFEVAGWEQWIGDEIARYEATPWRGISIGGSLPGAIILAALVILGIIALLRRSDIDLSTRWLVALWALAVTPSTLLLTPMEWQRYYMPVYPVIGLLAALGAAWLAGQLSFNLWRWRPE